MKKMSFNALGKMTESVLLHEEIYLLNNDNESDIFLGQWRRDCDGWRVAGIPNILPYRRFTHYACIPDTFLPFNHTDNVSVQPNLLLKDRHNIVWLSRRPHLLDRMNGNTSDIIVETLSRESESSVFVSYSNIPQLTG